MIFDRSWCYYQVMLESSQCQLLIKVGGCLNGGFKYYDITLEGFMWLSNDVKEVVSHLVLVYQL